MPTATPIPQQPSERGRPSTALPPLRDALRLRYADSGTLFLAARAAFTLGVPVLVLLAIGRLDLAAYVTCGTFAVIYAGHRPYRARARYTAGSALGLLAAMAVTLTVAGLNAPTWLRLVVVAVVAGVARLVCDAARAVPPGGIIITFSAAGTAFAPPQLVEVPYHLGLAALGGVWAFAVVMAPRLGTQAGRDRPQRLAVARALAAAPKGGPAAVPAIRDAWLALAAAGDAARSGTPAAASQAALVPLLVRAESVLYGEADDDPALASALRGRGPVPAVTPSPAERDVLAGIDADLRIGALGRACDDATRVSTWHRFVAPHLPGAARVFVGTGLAGSASFGLGIGRPYWAMITAAAILQGPNIGVAYHRAFQRCLGTLAGVFVAAGLVALDDGRLWVLALLTPVCMFYAESVIPRNYALAVIGITPLSLAMTEFMRWTPAVPMTRERVLDTLLGAAVGLLAGAAVRNRRSARGVEAALARTRTAHDALAQGGGTASRIELAGALASLRETYDVARGEWWQDGLPEREIVAVEHASHELLGSALRTANTHEAGVLR